jgi:hypothetical protein
MSNAQPNTRQRRPAKPKARRRGPTVVVDERGDFETGRRFLFFNVAPSWLVSFFTHLVLLLVLAFWFIPTITDKKIAFESGTSEGAATDSIEVDLDDFNSDAAAAQLDTPDLSSDMLSDFSDVQAELPTTDISDVGEMFSAEDFGQVPETGGVSGGNELGARSADGRRRARSEGATAESETAVDLALAWIVKHQLPDGGWNFDHTVGPGEFRDTEGAGTARGARNGATAMALLPLLGAGHTHKSGKYKESVQKGLDFLKRRGRGRGNASRLSYYEEDGRLYSHGLTAIVFCETYAMTRDEELRPYAQAAIKFTEYAQDPRGGGWRYEPRQQGDTSAVGWQIVALKSGKIAGLEINRRTFKRANVFLDFVSNSDGSEYGYLRYRKTTVEKSLNAIGLLCRMYLDWPKDRPGLVQGMSNISELGPDTEAPIDMYYNYYATQAMKHMYVGTPAWTRWNTEIRDFLVSAQERDGDNRGSWLFTSEWAKVGGRLYSTSMACMNLEIYYRYQPLYGKDGTVDEQFQLFVP